MISTKLSKYEKFIPVILFLLFVGLAIPGISWGAPDLWHPDELVWRVVKALDGELEFDETEPDYNYPSLPKYAMYGVGKLVYGLGGEKADVIIAARLMSALLGGIAIVLIYLIARTIGKSIPAGLFAAFLSISNNVLSHNARLAHNDFYLSVFILLLVYSLLKYRASENRLWLYGAFFGVGLAASSKYTGGSLIIVPAVIYLVDNRSRIRSNLLRVSETLLIGAGLSFVGYVVGTPKALLWMAFYFKRMLPMLSLLRTYDIRPSSAVGFFGQWGVFKTALGSPVYTLFLISFLWFFIKVILFRLRKIQEDKDRMNMIIVLLLTIIVFDLPIMTAYTYVPRYFIPLILLFSILSGLFIEELITLAVARGFSYAPTAISAGYVLIIAFATLRVISVMLLFSNDARIPAGEFIATLPKGTTLEYTFYHPTIPPDHFSRRHSYPAVFLKYPDQALPTGKAHKFNQGEAGLEDRQTDYFVVDSFTYARFSDEYTCQLNQTECDLFRDLLADETNYRLIKVYRYSLPAFLPRVSLPAINPEIRIYERQP